MRRAPESFRIRLLSQAQAASTSSALETARRELAEMRNDVLRLDSLHELTPAMQQAKADLTRLSNAFSRLEIDPEYVRAVSGEISNLRAAMLRLDTAPQGLIEVRGDEPGWAGQHDCAFSLLAN